MRQKQIGMFSVLQEIMLKASNLGAHWLFCFYFENRFLQEVEAVLALEQMTQVRKNIEESDADLDYAISNATAEQWEDGQQILFEQWLDGIDLTLPQRNFVMAELVRARAVLDDWENGVISDEVDDLASVGDLEPGVTEAEFEARLATHLTSEQMQQFRTNRDRLTADIVAQLKDGYEGVKAIVKAILAH